MVRKDFTGLPPLVQITANAHMAMLYTALPGLLLDYWVTGSAAMGDFHAGISDMDFLAIVNRRPAADELERLKRLHKRMDGCRLYARLDGQYLWQAGPAWVGLAFNGGKFTGTAEFKTNTADAWMLQACGVSAAGQACDVCPSAAGWSAFAAYMRGNLNGYWRRWIGNCERFGARAAFGLFVNPAVVEWGVLGISRLYFALREKDVTGKTGAGEYALGTVPEKWHSILREALRRRKPEIGRQYRSPVRRRRDALEYMKYIMNECARY